MNLHQTAGSSAIVAIVASCALVFLVGLATFLRILPLDLSGMRIKIRRRPANATIRWTAAGVAVAAAVVLVPSANALAHAAPGKN